MKALLLTLALTVATTAQARPLAPEDVKCKQVSTKTYCASAYPVDPPWAMITVKAKFYAARPKAYRVDDDHTLVQWFDGHVLNTVHVVTLKRYNTL